MHGHVVRCDAMGAAYTCGGKEALEVRAGLPLRLELDELRLGLGGFVPIRNRRMRRS